MPAVSHLILGALLCAAVPALAEAPDRIQLSALPSDRVLAEQLWRHSPELAAARGRWFAARADVDRALLLPNPSLDLSWNTLPVGETNPPGLSPLGEVPNYAASISQLFELGKRGPRQRAARGTALAATYDAIDLLRQQWFELGDHLASVASAELRIAALQALAVDGDRLTEIQRQRSAKGDTAVLDADRAELEAEKLQTQLGEEQAKLAVELGACARMLGQTCEPFSLPDRALAFLNRPAAAPAPLEQRPDLASLRAQEEAAEASRSLARAKAIPDPTVRVGFVRDQFVTSGAQPNSLFVGVSLPLPLFDHGQADLRAATAQAENATLARTRLQAQAGTEAVRLHAQLAALEHRRERMREKTLPLGRSLVTRLEGAVQRGGAALQELLLARRTLGELMLDSRDLDLAAFRLRAALERGSGTLPPVPSELSPE